jgi:cardiolipin synthase
MRWFPTWARWLPKHEPVIAVAEAAAPRTDGAERTPPHAAA